MVGEACLPSNFYYPRTPDYTLYSGVHVCWSEHFESSFVYGFMSLDNGLGTMTVAQLLSIIDTTRRRIRVYTVCYSSVSIIDRTRRLISLHCLLFIR